jgi:hypothetical protein
MPIEAPVMPRGANRLALTHGVGIGFAGAPSMISVIVS